MSNAVSYMNMPRNRWYVFANRSDAAVFQCHKSEPLQFVLRLKNQHVDLTPRNFEEDREHVADKFTSELASQISGAWNGQRFEELVLVAEPRILGKLRAKLPVSVIHSVVEEHPMDLTRISSEEAQERINSWKQKQFA